MRPTRLAALTLLASCHAAQAFSWPAPPGWKSETIPFPLEFARDIAQHGVEEVRFEPRFFDPAADTYFTYSFAWVLDGPGSPAPDALAADLRRYFHGLMSAVGKDKGAAFPDGAFDARVESNEAAAGRYRGVVHTVDAFGDGRAVTLNLDAVSLACGRKAVLLVSLSPHAPDDATFRGLLAQRDTFRCAP
jgi:hypothetical protein